MYRIAGDVVDPRVKRMTVTNVNLHQMPGSHSLEQLNRTVKVRLIPVREEDRLQVKVKVTNRAAGHVEAFCFPIAEGDPANVKATLSYYYSPFAATEGQKRVTFLTLSQFVP